MMEKSVNVMPAGGHSGSRKSAMGSPGPSHPSERAANQPPMDPMSYKLDTFTEAIVCENETMLIELSSLRSRLSSVEAANAAMTKSVSDLQFNLRMREEENGSLKQEVRALHIQLESGEQERAALKKECASLVEEYNKVKGLLESKASDIRKGFEGKDRITRVEALSLQLEQMLTEAKSLASSVQTISVSLRRCHVATGTQAEQFAAVIAKQRGMLAKLRESAQRILTPMPLPSLSSSNRLGLSGSGGAIREDAAMASSSIEDNAIVIVRSALWEALEAGMYAAEENLQMIGALHPTASIKP